MLPVLFEAGGLRIYSYGLAVLVASLVGVGWGVGFAPLRRVLTAEDVVGMALAGLTGGALGGRLGLVLLAGSAASVAHSGGLIQVAAAAGLASGAAYLRWRRLPVLAALDAGAAAIPLGMAIGRLGCLAAGCCWGRACQLPWAVVYTDPLAHAMTGVPLGVALHPAPIYHALASLAVFTAVRAAALHGGRLVPTALFLVGDGLQRLLLEPLRGDPTTMIGPLRLAGFAGVVFVVTGAALLATCRRRTGGAGAGGAIDG